MNTIAKNFRLDKTLCEEATSILEGLGLSMSQAVSIFLRQVALQRGLPFEVRYPRYSNELREAIAEGERLEANPKTKRYRNMKKMWKDLDK